MPHVQTTGFQPLTATLQGGSHRNERAVQRSLRDGVADALGVNAKGHGVHGLAVALREKLSAPSAGADAVPSILETINRALDDAAGKLAAQGVSQEQIDAGIARFRNKLAREIGEFVGADAAANQAVEKTAIAARQEVRERFSLDILTAEGDKVSIRFKSLNVTEVAAAQVTRDGATATAVETNVISRGRFKVEVDGNLNEAERTAIADLLDKVDGIATDFFGGDVQAAFSAAARVGLDSSALSAFDLKLSYSKSVAVAAYTSSAALTEPAKPQASEPVTLPAETQAPVVTPATSPVTTEPTAPAVIDAAPASEGTATTPAAAAATAKASSALETIASFAKEVLDRLDKDDESNATKFSLRWKVEFLMKAFGSVALTPVEQKAADALGISLDAQAPALV